MMLSVNAIANKKMIPLFTSNDIISSECQDFKKAHRNQELAYLLLYVPFSPHTDT